MKKKKIITLPLSLALLFALGWMMLLNGIHLFYIGFHDIDIVFNTKELSNRYDFPEGSEINLDGKVYTLTETYINGLKKLWHSIYFITIGSFLLGMTLIGNVFQSKLTK